MSGQPLNLEALAEGRRQLARLNIFRQVDVQLREPNRREQVKAILVTAQERPRIDGEVSGGYFLVDGPRLALDTAFPNVDSRGLNLLARGKINYVGWSAEALSGRYSLEGGQDASLQGWQGLGGPRQRVAVAAEAQRCCCRRRWARAWTSSASASTGRRTSPRGSRRWPAWTGRRRAG